MTIFATMTEQLKNITHTQGGYEVKDLKYKPLDNIIVGLVKDPQYGKPELYNGFICVQWTPQGKPLKINKGRTELNLTI